MNQGDKICNILGRHTLTNRISCDSLFLNKKKSKRSEEKSKPHGFLTENSQMVRGIEGSRLKMVSERHG